MCKKNFPVFPGKKQSASDSDEEASVLVRKVMPPSRKRKQVKVNKKEKPSFPVEPAMETASSPEESSGRTRSRKRSPTMEKALYVDTVPQKPQKAPRQKSKKQTHDTNRPSERQRRRTPTASPEFPTGNDEPSGKQELSSDEELVNKRKKKGQGAHNKRSKKIPQKSPSLVSPSSQSSENSDKSEKKRRTRIRVPKSADTAQTAIKGKQSKCKNVSPPTKALPTTSRSWKRPKAKKGDTEEPNEDVWTEAELLKLQE